MGNKSASTIISHVISDIIAPHPNVSRKFLSSVFLDLTLLFSRFYTFLAMTSSTSISLFADFVYLVCSWIGEPCCILLSIVYNSSKRNEGWKGYPTKLWMSNRNSPACVNTLTYYLRMLAIVFDISLLLIHVLKLSYILCRYCGIIIFEFVCM